MTKASVFLKSGSNVTIEDLTAINVHGNVTKSYDAKDLDHFVVVDSGAYIFVGAKKTVSIRGIEILYVDFTSD